MTEINEETRRLADRLEAQASDMRIQQNLGAYADTCEESAAAIRLLVSRSTETCEMQKQLAFCVEVFEAQLHEMGSDGSISTHVAEGKVEELRKLIESKHEVEK